MDHAEIQTIRTQYQAGQWPQLLETVTLSGLRGWTGQTVSFPFPVTAIVGENGTGKSTILKCAACGYENADRSKRFFPSSFFVETHWDTISGVTIDYRVKLGASVRTYRTTKPSQRWRVPEDMPKRNVFLMDVSRTLPLDAFVGDAKILPAIWHRERFAKAPWTNWHDWIVSSTWTDYSSQLMRINANARITTIVRDADCTRFDAHSSMSNIGFGYPRFLAPFCFFLQLPGEPFGIKTGARDKKRSQDDQGRQRGAKRSSN